MQRQVARLKSTHSDGFIPSVFEKGFSKERKQVVLKQEKVREKLVVISYFIQEIEYIVSKAICTLPFKSHVTKRIQSETLWKKNTHSSQTFSTPGPSLIHVFER